MKKYIVQVLGIQGRNNKVYGPGEIVTSDNFPEGNAIILEKEGKIKLKDDSNKDDSKIIDSKKTPKK